MREGRDGLPGPRGRQGKQGPQGHPGKEGCSAFDIARSKGFEGDEEAFLASLKGADGAQGIAGEQGPEGPQGKDGAPGRNGIDGEPGRTGKAGAAGAQGPMGPRGPEGPMGPMPRHVWEGTILRWELPSGKFDDGVDLKGPPGKSGRDGYGGASSSQSGVEEAPIDGSPYWRKDGAWVVAITGGSATWGAISGTLADQSDLVTALDAKANSADLGTASTHASTDFATAAQGAKADSALQSADISGFSIAWSQLTSTPTTLSGYGITDAAPLVADRRAVTALSISTGVVDVDCSLGDFFTLDITANVTSITFSNLPASGKACCISIRMKQDGTGSRTVALPSSFKAIGSSDTEVQSAANAYTIIVITTFDQGTRWEYAMKAGAA